MNTGVSETIKKYCIVPVVVFNSVDEVRPKLRAMCDGGLPVAEITLVSVRNVASKPCQKPKTGDRNSFIYAYTLKVGLWHRPI